MAVSGRLIVVLSKLPSSSPHSQAPSGHTASSSTNTSSTTRTNGHSTSSTRNHSTSHPSRGTAQAVESTLQSGTTAATNTATTNHRSTNSTSSATRQYSSFEDQYGRLPPVGREGPITLVVHITSIITQELPLGNVQRSIKQKPNVATN